MKWKWPVVTSKTKSGQLNSQSWGAAAAGIKLNYETEKDFHICRQIHKYTVGCDSDDLFFLNMFYSKNEGKELFSFSKIHSPCKIRSRGPVLPK